MKKGRLLLCLMVLVLFLLGTAHLQTGRRAQGARQLEAVIRRTAAACYAAEGFYPPSLAYMKQNYALRYEEEAYTVGYEVFASNLMPEITVVEK